MPTYLLTNVARATSGNAGSKQFSNFCPLFLKIISSDPALFSFKLLALAHCSTRFSSVCLVWLLRRDDILCVSSAYSYIRFPSTRVAHVVRSAAFITISRLSFDVRPCSVNIKLRDRWADIDGTWHAFSTGLQ